MTHHEIFDRQSACVSIARLVPKAFLKAQGQPGAIAIETANLTAFTLFYNPVSGLVQFDLDWDQGDAYTEKEQQYCQLWNLVVAGYYTQYEIQTLSQFQLGERIYHHLKELSMQ